LLLWRGDQITVHRARYPRSRRAVSILVVVEGRSDRLSSIVRTRRANCGFNPCCCGGAIRSPRCLCASGRCRRNVSILVVVEGRSDHQRKSVVIGPTLIRVSILVVVEGRSDLLDRAASLRRPKSFNPCCCGGAIRSWRIARISSSSPTSFNPCCCGGAIRSRGMQNE